MFSVSTTYSVFLQLTDLTKKVKNFKENEMDESEELESERTSSVSMEIHTDGAPEVSWSRDELEVI